LFFKVSTILLLNINFCKELQLFTGINQHIKPSANTLKYKPKRFFLKRVITTKKFLNIVYRSGNISYFFLNRFLVYFLERLLNTKIFLNLKKCSKELKLKRISSRVFTMKYFKKRMGIDKQILGVLYYTFLLKDATIFVNFFKKVVDNVNLKLHKKLFLGLRKLIKDFFQPIFQRLLVVGVFFNVVGKIGVSGNAKKRRYFFFFGKHSITNREMRLHKKKSFI